MRRILSRAVTVAVVAAITLGALEIVCRIVDPIGISYYPETARWLDTLVVKEPIGYWNRKGLVGTYFGAPVRINSLGLRGPEVAAKAPGEYRILMTGDSFPFGIGVPEENALPASLEAALRASDGPKVDYRVLNLGVVSYNSEQELRQLEETGLALRPDMVLLAFAVNDIEPVMWVFEKRRGVLLNAAQRSYAVSLLAFTARSVKYKLAGFSGIALGEYREDGERWRTVDRCLSRMNALCREAGTRFVVFVYDDLADPKDLVKGVGRREGFPVLDLAPAMHARLVGKNPLALKNSLVDSHPNVEGNGVWAEILLDALTEAGVLPAGRP